jgi:hypothetical protein
MLGHSPVHSRPVYGHIWQNRLTQGSYTLNNVGIQFFSTVGQMIRQPRICGLHKCIGYSEIWIFSSNTRLSKTNMMNLICIKVLSQRPQCVSHWSILIKAMRIVVLTL